MKALLLIISIIACHTVAAQDYIGDNRKTVKRKMEQYMKGNRYKQYQVKETDSSVVYTLREEKVQPVDFVYGIGPKGICYATTTSSPCLECVEKTLKAVLGHKRYDWKQLNDSTWISDYRHSLQLTLHRNETGLSAVDIRKMLWSKRLHAELLPPEK